MIQIHDDILFKIARYICNNTNYLFPYRIGRELSVFKKILNIKLLSRFSSAVVRTIIRLPV